MSEQQQPLDAGAVDDGMSYKEFLGIIKRNMDPGSNTVLLVDDERAIRAKVARDVSSCDSSLVIFQAGNGKEALQRLAEIRSKYYRDPLFIVLDLNMPVMDGWETITALKKEYETAGKPQGIPIVVLSSTSGEKGALFLKKSVHDGKSGYTPLVCVAKEACVEKGRYDASGERGLMAWLKYFTEAGK